jgi:hypothetical protein
MRVYDDMFAKFASGFAKAITEHKNFGATLMGVLKQVENEILDKVIGSAFAKMSAALGDVLVKHGGAIGEIGKRLGGKTAKEKEADVKTAEKELADALKAASEKQKNAADEHLKAATELEASERDLIGPIKALNDQIATLTDKLGGFFSSLPKLAGPEPPAPVPPAHTPQPVPVAQSDVVTTTPEETKREPILEMPVQGPFPAGTPALTTAFGAITGELGKAAAAIQKRETGGEKHPWTALTRIPPPPGQTYTASGGFQITDPTWKDGIRELKQAGLDISKFPAKAMQASKEQQQEVFTALMAETKKGLGPQRWAASGPYDPQLMKAAHQEAMAKMDALRDAYLSAGAPVKTMPAAQQPPAPRVAARTAAAPVQPAAVATGPLNTVLQQLSEVARVLITDFRSLDSVLHGSQANVQAHGSASRDAAKQTEQATAADKTATQGVTDLARAAVTASTDVTAFGTKAATGRGAGGGPGGDQSAVKDNTKAVRDQKHAAEMQAAGAMLMLGGLVANVTHSKALGTALMILGGIIEAFSAIQTIIAAAHTATEVTNTAAVGANTAAVVFNTAVKLALPFAQHGAVVTGVGATPVMVHGGEVIANKQMLQTIGASLSTGATVDMRATNAQLQGIGDQLSAKATGGDTHLHMDGAVFHGVPDQRYVNSIMDTAVRSLRNSSRTWAFNPTGQ